MKVPEIEVRYAKSNHIFSRTTLFSYATHAGSLAQYEGEGIFYGENDVIIFSAIPVTLFKTLYQQYLYELEEEKLLCRKCQI